MGLGTGGGDQSRSLQCGNPPGCLKHVRAPACDVRARGLVTTHTASSPVHAAGGNSEQASRAALSSQETCLQAQG